MRKERRLMDTGVDSRMVNVLNNSCTRRAYKVEEIAEMLGIGRTAAYNLIHSGKLKVVRIGTSIRVPKHSIDAWLESQN